jgi:hypothetical protein
MTKKSNQKKATAETEAHKIYNPNYTKDPSKAELEEFEISFPIIGTLCYVRLPYHGIDSWDQFKETFKLSDSQQAIYFTLFTIEILTNSIRDSKAIFKKILSITNNVRSFDEFSMFDYFNTQNFWQGLDLPRDIQIEIRNFFASRVMLPVGGLLSGYAS